MAGNLLHIRGSMRLLAQLALVGVSGCCAARPGPMFQPLIPTSGRRSNDAAQMVRRALTL
jgi:hypothetical protein